MTLAKDVRKTNSVKRSLKSKRKNAKKKLSSGKLRGAAMFPSFFEYRVISMLKKRN
jgi:hypothetical protein